MTTTDFSNIATERPNYFPGQYLLEDDFELEHKYLGDRLNYHNHSLQVSGIIEGLEVEAIENQKEVQILPGSAIDNQGNLIILKEAVTFTDFGSLSEGELSIKYEQLKKVKQQEEIKDSFTRWQEEAVIEFNSATPQDSVTLAKLNISGNTITLVDDPVVEYSGLRLPSDNGTDLVLRSGGKNNPNLAVLTGSLSIDGDLTVEGTGTSSFAGDLTVSGTISGTIDAENITSGELAVERIPELSASKITEGTLAVDRIPNLNANKINAGTLAVDRIPDLSADKITAGTITGDISLENNLTIGGHLQVNSISGIGENSSGEPATDSFRIRMETNYFGNNEDAVIFEKTDWNNDVPDGGIVFANTGSNNELREALAIKGNGNIIVSGDLILTSRRGNFAKGQVNGDGDWHTIVSGLSGHNAFEIIASIGISGQHALTHAIALSTFMDNNHITKRQAYFRIAQGRIDVQWSGTTYDYNLQIRSLSNYGSGNKIKYYVTALWLDAWR